MIQAGIVILNSQAQENEDWYQKALFFNRSGQQEKAINAFSKAIEIDPGRANAYNNRGAIWYQKKDYDKAIEDYSRAIALDPKSASFYLNRGAAWFKKEHLDNAMNDFNQAVTLDRSSYEAFNSRGMTWYLMEEYEKAILDYTQALKLNSKISEFYNNRGAAWFAMGKFDRAVVDYSRALGLDPVSINVLKNRGFCWFKKGFFDAAVSDYSTALEIDINSIDIYVSRGMAFYEKGDYSKALIDFVDAVRLSPENPDALRRLAWMLAACPDEDYRNGVKAVELAQKAFGLSPNLGTLDALAVANAEAGNLDTAVQYMETMVSKAREVQLEISDDYIVRLETFRSGKPWRSEHIYPAGEAYDYPIVRTVQALNGKFYSEPSEGSFLIEQLTQGHDITLIGKDGQWFLTQFDNGQFGWINQNVFDESRVSKKEDVLLENTAGLSEDREKPFLRPVGPEPVKTRPKEVEVSVHLGRIRERPSADSKILFKVKKGNKLKLLDEINDWKKVDLGRGKVGWGHKSIF